MREQTIGSWPAEWTSVGRPAHPGPHRDQLRPMVVGNLGSKYRFAYGVVGDQVNLGSRLEGLNKVYGTDIIIGENTAGLVEHAFRLRELDMVRVKGRTQTVRIYELDREGRGPRWSAEHDQVLWAYAEALEAYRKGMWTEALGLFDQALRLRPDDGPARTLARRCVEYRDSHPSRGTESSTSRSSDRRSRLGFVGCPALRRPPLARLPLVLRARPDRDDGRQHRARHQLLGHVPEVPLAHAGRLRGHQPLGAVPALLLPRRRSRRPLRLPPADPDLAGAVHAGLGRVGRALPHRSVAGVARRRDPARARRRRGHRRPRPAADHPRHGRRRPPAQRHPAERQQPLPGDPARPRGGWRPHAAAGARRWPARQRRPLLPVLDPAPARALHGPPPRGRPAGPGPAGAGGRLAAAGPGARRTAAC